MGEFTQVDWAAIALVVIGALNWGLYGLGGLVAGGPIDLVALVLGSIPVLQNLVYVVVGLAGLYVLYWAYDEAM